MLVLTRKAKEEIRIGNDITVTIVRVKGQSVRIGINAPDHVHIMRSELANQDEATHQDSSNRDPAKRLPSQESNSVQERATSQNNGTPDGSVRTSTESQTNDRTVTDLTANSPLIKRLENQLNTRSTNASSNQSTNPSSRFQSPLGSTDSFSRVFGREKLNRAHRTMDDADKS